MAVHINKLAPVIAIHPGEMLKDELESRSITQKDFSQLTGIPQTQLNEIIKGKRGIYADTALLIGKALKMDPVLWINMQMNFELDLAKINEKNQERLEAIDIWQMVHEYIPFKYFKKEGILSGNPIQDIPLLKEIYSIGNIEQLMSLYSKTNYARFRSSTKLTIDKINLVGWVKVVVYKAAQLNVSKFDHRKEKELVKALNEVFTRNKKVIEKTKEVLAIYGIKLIIQAHPEKCAVDGISFWSNGNPAIGLTVRHKRLDNFAFTVFHEIGHVFKHLLNDNTAEFIDLEDDNARPNNNEENEADEFARNCMIDQDAWDTFMRQSIKFNEEAIRSFAKKHNVNPAIVQGRFLFETGDFKVRSSIAKSIN